MGWTFCDMVKFDLVTLQGQTRLAKVKSAYKLLIIAPRGLACETNRKSWAWNLLMCSDLTVGPAFKVKQE